MVINTTNLEKYKDEIIKGLTVEERCDYKRSVLKICDCRNISCTHCEIDFINWLASESEVDWSEVPEGTTIEVSDDCRYWATRQFSHLYKGKVYTRNIENSDEFLTSYEHARLRKDGDEHEN